MLTINHSTWEQMMPKYGIWHGSFGTWKLCKSDWIALFQGTRLLIGHNTQNMHKTTTNTVLRNVIMRSCMLYLVNVFLVNLKSVSAVV